MMGEIKVWGDVLVPEWVRSGPDSRVGCYHHGDGCLMRHGSLCFVSDWRLALGVGIRFVKAKQEPAKNDMSGYA